MANSKVVNCNLMEIGGFRGSSWERPYKAAMTAIADRVNGNRKNGLDSEAVFDIILHSIDHGKAQFEIARCFMKYLCTYFDARLGLDLLVDVTAYRRGVVSGRLMGRPSDEDLMALVGRKFLLQCGDIPDFALDLKGRYIFEWLLWCIEVIEGSDAERLPSDDLVDELLERFQLTGAVATAVETALNMDVVVRRMQDPTREMFERTHRGPHAARGW